MTAAPASVLSGFVFAAGALHFVQLPALLLYKREGTADVDALSPMGRAVQRTMTLGILLVVLGLGIVVMMNAAELAGGSLLARSLCAFLAVFWAFRAAMQVLIFSKHFKDGWRGRMKHYGALTVLLVKTGIYLTASLVS